MKLLVVDDSLVMRRSLERSLGAGRFTEIRSAEDGRAAVAAYGDFKPDLVTMDITMPGMDGLSAVDAILAQDPNARILVVSALGDKSTAVEAVKRGAQGFLLKPVSPSALREAVEDAIGD